MLGSSPGPIVASLYHTYRGRGSNVRIYLHNPPLLTELEDDFDRNILLILNYMYLLASIHHILLLDLISFLYLKEKHILYSVFFQPV